jgi:DNA-binding NtrC family response regulator
LRGTLPVFEDGAAETKHTVLVVDDEAGIRKLVRTLLERDGFTVLSAPEADSALEVLRDRSGIDLVMIDVVIPGRMDGLGLLDQLRSTWPGMAVLVMSGLVSEPYSLSDSVPFLKKPFSATELLLGVSLALERPGLKSRNVMPAASR